MSHITPIPNPYNTSEILLAYPSIHPNTFSSCIQYLQISCCNSTYATQQQPPPPMRSNGKPTKYCFHVLLFNNTDAYTEYQIQNSFYIIPTLWFHSPSAGRQYTSQSEHPIVMWTVNDHAAIIIIWRIWILSVWGEAQTYAFLLWISILPLFERFLESF